MTVGQIWECSYLKGINRKKTHLESAREEQAELNSFQSNPTCVFITYFSSRWRQGGHLMASHVFHFTCRTLYTCPKPPEPIFSQLLNSEESKVFSSPMFSRGESGTSISRLRDPPTGWNISLFLRLQGTKGGSKHTNTDLNSLWALPCFSSVYCQARPLPAIQV